MASQHPHPFRFGLINETPCPPCGWANHVRQAESLGYSTFLIRDHLGSDFFGDQLAPLAALASAATLTTRLRVGTMVLDNDFRHPALLAKELATIDLLSGGRLEIGLGAGWLQAEYDAAGLRYDPAPTRIERLAEAITVLKHLFSGRTTHHWGRHYRVQGMTSFPAPIQQPHPPIMVGGGRPKILELAGREATTVSILTSSVATGTLTDGARERLPEAVDQKLGWVRRGAGQRYPELELSLVPIVLITKDPTAAAQQLIRDRGWQDIDQAQVLQMPSVFLGTIDHIAEQMQLRRDRYGFSYYQVSDRKMHELAPLMDKLTGE
jgi:probable F420-dependent oxidoreductase